MTIIEQIKAKIERQIANLRGQEKDFLEQDCHTLVEDARARISELNQLLSFLDTLESEKPMQEGLEEEIERYLSTEWELDEDLNKDEPIYIYDCTWEDLKILARHFAQWGAEHLKR